MTKTEILDHLEPQLDFARGMNAPAVTVRTEVLEEVIRLLKEVPDQP